jgi:phenol 2-monooxygenase (NADPH)
MDEAGISMNEFKDAFEKGNLFASGVAVDYGASLIVAKAGDAAQQGDGTDVSQKQKSLRVVGKQELASKIKIGMRMPSFKVLSQSDARPWHFQERLKSDGRWRVVVFAGDVSNPKQMERVQTLGKNLKSSGSFVSRFTPPGKPVDSVIEAMVIHSASRTFVDIFDFPEIFRPFDKRDGWDYMKIYVDDQSYHEGHGQAYKNYGVDPKTGCVVILRPDQYVGFVGALEDVAEMDHYFSGFMIAHS